MPRYRWVPPFRARRLRARGILVQPPRAATGCEVPRRRGRGRAAGPGWKGRGGLAAGRVHRYGRVRAPWPVPVRGTAPAAGNHGVRDAHGSWARLFGRSRSPASASGAARPRPAAFDRSALSGHRLSSTAENNGRARLLVYTVASGGPLGERRLTPVALMWGLMAKRRLPDAARARAGRRAGLVVAGERVVAPSVHASRR